MKIVKQGLSLSEDDLALIDPKVVTTMMKQRLVVEFDESPDIDNLDFSGASGFYHIRSLGSKLYQFWFEKAQDYDAFYQNIIAYKLSTTTTDK